MAFIVQFGFREYGNACESSGKEQVWVNSEDALLIGLSDEWGWNVFNVSVRNTN